MARERDEAMPGHDENLRRRRTGIRGSTVVLAALAAAGCDGGDAKGHDFSRRTVGLLAFDGCDDLHAFFKAEALAALERDGGWGPPAREDLASGGEGRGVAGSDESPAPPQAPEHSETNVQEAGVDEPDGVKTDGRYLYVVRDWRLLVYDAADLGLVSETPVAGDGGALLVDGDRAVVLSRIWGAPAETFAGVDEARLRRHGKTVVEVFDLTDRAAPTRLRRLYVEGDLLSARLAGGTVRAAVHFTPSIDVERPGGSGGSVGSGGSSSGGWGGGEVPPPIEARDAGAAPPAPADESAPAREPASGGGGDAADTPRTDADEVSIMPGGGVRGPGGGRDWQAPWREAIAGSRVDDFLPWAYDVAGEAREVGRVAACERFHRPGERAGVGVTAVVSIDLDRPLERLADPAVVTGPGVVYASPTSLYLTTTNFYGFGFGGGVAVGGGVARPTDDAVAVDAPAVGTRRSALEVADERAATQIHRLDIADPDAPATYRQSGRVYGHPLNSFSLGEHEGALRIATTEPRPSGDTGNHLFVLRPGADAEGAPALEVVGRVEGLAPGERIYAARFQGERGFLVTFRQIDPLFTLDLADPTAPRVVGELKVPGYSTYLHPLDDDHLLGIGQAATDEGFITGMQLSLFDVSDFARPTRLHQHEFGAGWSQALYDHHAFTWWAPESLLMVPVSAWEEGEPRQGIDVFRVDVAEGIAARGHITHADLLPEGHWVEPQRTLVIGDALYSVSSAGIKANGLDDLVERARAVFPAAAGGGRAEPGGPPVSEPAPRRP